MKPSSLLVLAAPLLLLAPVACQAIANIDSRSTDPLPAQGSCALPSSGNGRIRLVNVASEANVAAAQNLVDFCIRPSGTSDWGRPVFRDGGDSYSSTPDALCSKGLPYAQSTIPFSVPAGKIDVKAIPAGSTCSATATSQVTNVSVGDAVNHAAPVVTIVRWGGDQTSEALAALSEEPSTGMKNTDFSYFRVVNALSSRGSPSIEFGIPTDMTLPTTVATPLLYPSPIKPGSVAPTGTTGQGTTIDAQGYNRTVPQSFYYAASVAGDPVHKAVALFHTPFSTGGDMATLYVMGEPSSNAYPLRGLFCEDNGALTAGADAGSSALPTSYSAQDLRLLARCTPTPLPLLSIDTFNVSLYGANAPYEGDRWTAIPSEIAARTSDLMCLLEVGQASYRQTIASLAAMTANGQPGQFPYSYSIDTTETTPPTNPSDVMPTPTSPPCAGLDISNIVSCVDQKCSTAPDGGTGILNGSTNCLSSNCAGQLGAAYFSHHYCFDCIIYYLTSLQEISAMQTACTQDDNPPFAFVGQTPSMILSHFPLKNTKAYVLPSTGFRRAVLKAQVQLEDQTVDFFCGQLSSPLIDADLPYTGMYGSDTGPNMNGWEDEQDLQAKEAIAWIEKEADTDGLPAIIAGDWHSSVPCTGMAGSGCTTALGALSPEVNATLTSTKGKNGKTAVRADPPGYERTCDYCTATSTVTPNSYDTTTNSYEWTPTYVYGFPPNPGVSETLWDTGNIVSIPEMNGMMAPISASYPRNVQLYRPH